MIVLLAYRTRRWFRCYYNCCLLAHDIGISHVSCTCTQWIIAIQIVQAGLMAYVTQVADITQGSTTVVTQGSILTLKCRNGEGM